MISRFLLTAVSTAAQYRFDHWTTENGLPQNSVRDILQMRGGYLWFTTFDGYVLKENLLELRELISNLRAAR